MSECKVEPNGIFLGDAYELIKQVPDKSVDLIYTDIPYLMKMGGGKFVNARPSYAVEVRAISDGIDYSIFDDFVRVCKKIYCYIWCSKDQILDIGNYFVSKGCSFNVLVWCKTNPTPFANNTFLPDLEYCVVVRESGTKLNDGVKLKSKWYISQSNTADKKEFGHPTIKPLDLVERHILHSTQPNDLVLDAFVGSGTTCVACKHTGRRYIGFEISEDFYKKAVDRLNGINQNGRPNLLETDFDKLEEHKASLFEQ